MGSVDYFITVSGFLHPTKGIDQSVTWGPTLSTIWRCTGVQYYVVRLSIGITSDRQIWRHIWVKFHSTWVKIKRAHPYLLSIGSSGMHTNQAISLFLKVLQASIPKSIYTPTQCWERTNDQSKQGKEWNSFYGHFSCRQNACWGTVRQSPKMTDISIVTPIPLEHSLIQVVIKLRGLPWSSPPGNMFMGCQPRVSS